MLDGISNLLQNKMFLQMLSAAGSDVSQGTGGTNLNAAVQGNIQSQNFAKMLKQLLGPDGSKATFSKDGLTLTAPQESSLFSSILGDKYFANTPEAGQSVTPSNTAVGGGFDQATFNAQSPEQRRTSFDARWGGPTLNPFVEGQSSGMNLDFSAADLAGLTPQDISTALRMKMKQDELQKQTVQQVYDNMYKGKLMEQIDAQVATQSPRFEIPGLGKVNASQYLDWEKLNRESKPNEAKLYEYALRQGYEGSFVDFMDRAKTTHKKDYDEAVKGGYKGPFHNWMLEMAKAGAINLGEFTEREKTKKDIEAESYFSSGKFNADLDKKLEKYTKDELWNIPEAGKPAKIAEFKITKALDELEARGYTVNRRYWLDADKSIAAIDVTSRTGNKETIKIRVK